MAKKMFTLILLMLILSLLFAGCVRDGQYPIEQVSLRGDMEVREMSSFVWIYDSIDTLFSLSTHVARVEILDERTELVNRWIGQEHLGFEGEYDVLTVNTIKLLEVFKGGHEAGQIIEISQLGGRYGNVYLNVTDNTPLTIGDELILFFDDHGFDLTRPAIVHCSVQSAYHVSSATERSNQASSMQDTGILQAYEMGIINANDKFEGVNESNNLSLTVGDLIRLTKPSNN
ncbi:MAG: hypothetical protein FWC32_00650 [Firmicutes bacterium]|nr:hypothetical protein [Bacillota bacterium]